jgi:aryl-alcohol dehydrogenase-like predicted oxidoreductase
MKLAIGTAQFGLDYGVSNQSGQVSEDHVGQILKAAKRAGVETLDTAAGYGSSERSLGRVGVSHFEVITKFGALPDHITNIKRWVYDQIEGSLDRLNVNVLHGCLMHCPNDLLGSHGDSIYEALSETKVQGLTQNIGISIYDPEQLDHLMHRFDFNIVQAPMNIFDRRIDSSGWLNRLKKTNTQVHIRSVFLQGLLLMDPVARPDYFSRWMSMFHDYDVWLARSNMSALDACTGFVQQFENVQKIIIGVASLSQLESIIEAMSANAMVNAPHDLKSDDIKLINPSEWSL